MAYGIFDAPLNANSHHFMISSPSSQTLYQSFRLRNDPWKIIGLILFVCRQGISVWYQVYTPNLFINHSVFKSAWKKCETSNPYSSPEPLKRPLALRLCLYKNTSLDKQSLQRQPCSVTSPLLCKSRGRMFVSSEQILEYGIWLTYGQTTAF